MKVSILQENLVSAVTKTNRIVSAKPALPVLSHLLLLADGEGLTVTSSTLDTTESVLVGAKTEKPGGLCVPAKIFSDLVSSLPQDTVSIEETEGSLHLTCGGVSATLAGIASGEFPPVSSPSPKKETRLEKAGLVYALSLVLFAASSDEGRPLLTGVKISQSGEGTALAATDGFRLSVYASKLPFPKDTNLVIPSRALTEVVRVCQEAKEDKNVLLSQTDDGQLVVRAGETTIITRRIDGAYPDYEKIIPARHTTAAALDVQQFTRAVKSASIFARDSANIIRLRIEKNTLTISANAPQVGENTVVIEAKTGGEDGDIAFNSRFLLELLSNFPGEELVFEMTGALNPGAFKSPKDPAFLHIVMPVRTQG